MLRFVLFADSILILICFLLSLWRSLTSQLLTWIISPQLPTRLLICSTSWKVSVREMKNQNMSPLNNKIFQYGMRIILGWRQMRINTFRSTLPSPIYPKVGHKFPFEEGASHYHPYQEEKLTHHQRWRVNTKISLHKLILLKYPYLLLVSPICSLVTSPELSLAD